MYETNLICLAEYYVFLGSVMSRFLKFVFLKVIDLRAEFRKVQWFEWCVGDQHLEQFLWIRAIYKYKCSI